MQIKINQLMTESGVQFGTSGVRGLVTDMTDKVCWAYVTAFLQHLRSHNMIKSGSKVGIGGDLRKSSPRIMAAAARAVIDNDLIPINLGEIPSPAVALYGLKHAVATIMVTGSHIPDDRNGMKFNTPLGEILKADEQAIKTQIVNIDDALFSASGNFIENDVLPEIDSSAEQDYIDRFVQFFPENCLQDKKIGLYEHSSVSRSCLKVILERLGASVISLGRSAVFVSVDTEAIRPEDVRLAKQWCENDQFDCLISTDGDGDRPLISDQYGNWLRGDIAGMLCAQYLGVDVVVTPVSSNSAVEKSQQFKQVIRTKIGSPYVIEAMTMAGQGSINKVAGYEANGGFLQHTNIDLNNKTLTALPTRDATIVPLSILMLTVLGKTSVAELLKSLPQRYTASDRLKDFPTDCSKYILDDMVASDNETNLANATILFDAIGRATHIDQTDGVRITFDNGDIVHLRPSGNAPELRCYNEADSEVRAIALNQTCMTLMAKWRT